MTKRNQLKAANDILTAVISNTEDDETKAALKAVQATVVDALAFVEQVRSMLIVNRASTFHIQDLMWKLFRLTHNWVMEGEIV